NLQAILLLPVSFGFSVKKAATETLPGKSPRHGAIAHPPVPTSNASCGHVCLRRAARSSPSARPSRPLLGHTRPNARGACSRPSTPIDRPASRSGSMLGRCVRLCHPSQSQNCMRFHNVSAARGHLIARREWLVARRHLDCRNRLHAFEYLRYQRRSDAVVMESPLLSDGNKLRSNQFGKMLARRERDTPARNASSPAVSDCPPSKQPTLLLVLCRPRAQQPPRGLRRRPCPMLLPATSPHARDEGSVRTELIASHNQTACG